MTGRHQRMAELRRLLAETGLPWSIKGGRRHAKVTIDGELVGVISFGSGDPDRDFFFIEKAIRERVGERAQ